MSLAASIISSTLNAGTPLLIAAVGIIIHEKSGVLNLGIEDARRPKSPACWRAATDGAPS